MNTLNKDILTPILQEILAENPDFFCFTDHQQLKILSWNSKTVPSAKVLKIGDKKFIGFPKKDRHGNDYWKYQPCRENTLGTSANNSSDSNQSETNNITKFQHRQNQAKDYEQPNKSESATVNQQSR